MVRLYFTRWKAHSTRGYLPITSWGLIRYGAVQHTEACVYPLRRGCPGSLGLQKDLYFNKTFPLGLDCLPSGLQKEPKQVTICKQNTGPESSLLTSNKNLSHTEERKICHLLETMVADCTMNNYDRKPVSRVLFTKHSMEGGVPGNNARTCAGGCLLTSPPLLPEMVLQGWMKSMFTAPQGQQCPY